MKNIVAPPTSLEAFPGQIIKAYQSLGYETHPIETAVYRVIENHTKIYQNYARDAIGADIPNDLFWKWFFEHSLMLETEEYTSWLDPLNDLFGQILIQDKPECRSEEGRENASLYATLLLLLAPILSLKSMLRLDKGWNALCWLSGDSFPGFTIEALPHFLPRNRKEHIDITKYLGEVKSHAVQRIIVALLGKWLPDENDRPFGLYTSIQAHRVPEPWYAEAQEKCFHDFPHLYENIASDYGEFGTKGEGLAKLMTMQVNDFKILSSLVKGQDPIVRKVAIGRMQKIMLYHYDKYDWSSVYTVAKKCPEEFKEVTCMDLGLIDIFWDMAEPEYRMKAVTGILMLLSSEAEVKDDNGNRLDKLPDDRKHLELLIDQFVSFLDEDEELVVKATQNCGYGSSSLTLLTSYLLAERNISPIIPVVWDVIANRDRELLNVKQYPGLMQRLVCILLNKHAALIHSYPIKKIAGLFSLIDFDTLLVIKEELYAFAQKSKMVRQNLCHALSTMNPEILERTGWLYDKKIRGTIVSALIDNNHPESAKYLQKLYAAPNTHNNDKDRILDHLESSGCSVEVFGEEKWRNLKELEKYALRQKVDERKIKAILSDDLRSMLPPLNTISIRWLLALCADNTKKKLPRTVQEILSFTGKHDLQKFVKYLIGIWIERGDKGRLDWILPFAPYGDDQLVPLLSSAINEWGKKKLARTKKAMECLSHLNTQTSLYELGQICDMRRFPFRIRNYALDLLKTKAKQENVSVQQLREELVLDYGIKNGKWQTDLGARVVTIKLLPDLTLRVVNEKGKATKNFPKTKTDDDPQKAIEAVRYFKLLKKNIKKIADSQKRVITNAQMSASNWPVSRWQQLYVQHPLLSIMAQGIIWSLREENGNYIGSFIVDSGELVDHNCKPFSLKRDGVVGVYHPIEDSKEVHLLWAKCFTQKKTASLLNQTHQQVLKPTREEIQSGYIFRQQGIRFNTSSFVQHMRQNGYTVMVEDKGWGTSCFNDFGSSNIVVMIETSGFKLPAEKDERLSIQYAQVMLFDAGKDDYYRACCEETSLDVLPASAISAILNQLEFLGQKGLPAEDELTQKENPELIDTFQQSVFSEITLTILSLSKLYLENDLGKLTPSDLTKRTENVINFLKDTIEKDCFATQTFFSSPLVLLEADTIGSVYRHESSAAEQLHSKLEAGHKKLLDCAIHGLLGKKDLQEILDRLYQVSFTFLQPDSENLDANEGVAIFLQLMKQQHDSLMSKLELRPVVH